MAYCTFQNAIDIYSLGLLERLSTRAGDVDNLTPPEVEDRVQMALDSSAGYMDTFFMAVYPVPLSFSSSATAALLRNCNAALAVSELVIQHGYVTGTEDEQLVREARRQWTDWLASIRNGKTQLPGVSPDSVESTQSVAQDRFFVSSEESFFPPSDRFV